MFHSLVLYWVCGEVDNIDIITVDQGGPVGRNVKLM